MLKTRNFYVGKCDVCEREFQKVRKLRSGKWVCDSCLDKIGNNTKMEYDLVLTVLQYGKIPAELIETKLRVILDAFRYTEGLMTEKERQHYETIINEWEDNDFDDFNGGDE